MKRILILTFCLMTLSPQGFASTSGVSSGNPTKGSKVVVRSSYTNDNDSTSQDNRLRTRAHYEHGFTDNYALRLILTQNKNDGEELKHDSFRIENRFQFFEESKDGFHGTIRVGYDIHRSDADEIRVRFNGSKKFAEDWQYRQNIIFGHEVGDESESGMLLETRFAVQKAINNIDVGIDMLNDFGNLRTQSGFDDQSHIAGAFVKGDVTENLSYEFGYRHGISEGSGDNSVRLFLGYSF